jgi:hypothetical protein
MGVVMRVGMVVALMLTLNAWRGHARTTGDVEIDQALRHRVERRFEVLPVRGGIVLTPRRASSVRSVEIRDGVIALDGVAATGAELRQRLPGEADLLLELSYVDPDALATWWEEAPGARAAPALPKPPSPSAAPLPPAAPEPATPDAELESDRHWRRSAAKIHIGGDVTVTEDERVTDPVVAVGGSVTVLGHVDDDVVAVGGSVHLGPKAVVLGDVTTIGGRVDQAPGSNIRGRVNEVRFGAPHLDIHPRALFFGPFDGWNLFSGWFRLVGTVLRVGIVLLLAMLVLLIAERPVERIGERAAREPWLSGFTGLLAQLLFVPVLVLTVVVLAVSIIGIPLLVLVPFGLLAFLLAVLVGFSGVALRIGRWAVGTSRPPFVALAVGVTLVAAVGLLARGLALVPAPLWPLTWMVGVAGFFVEYVAWTVGLGAALLTRFGSRGLPYGPPAAYPPPVPQSGGPTEA